MNKNLALVALVAIIGFIIAGFLFTKNGSLTKQVQELNDQLKTVSDKLNDAEKELIYYKNTDLAKEVQLLQLQLTAAEKDLATSQQDASSAQARVKTLETNLAKIGPYLDAMQAISDMFFDTGPTDKGVARIDAKIAVLKDASISNVWADAKSGIDTERRSWSGESIGKTMSAIISQINSLLQ